VISCKIERYVRQFDFSTVILVKFTQDHVLLAQEIPGFNPENIFAWLEKLRCFF
jgi:hypothetical protein